MRNRKFILFTKAYQEAGAHTTHRDEHRLLLVFITQAAPLSLKTSNNATGAVLETVSAYISLVTSNISANAHDLVPQVEDASTAPTSCPCCWSAP